MPKYTLKNKRKRIAGLIKRLENGKTVQARDVDLVLTSTQKAEMRKDWQAQLEMRKSPKPAGVVDYERRLQKALMWYGRYDKLSGKQPKGAASVKKRSAKVDALELKQIKLFEEAFEQLQEIRCTDLSLCVWFDRNIDFTHGFEPELSPDGMPRVITSRSLNNLVGNGWKQYFGIKNKTKHKIDVLSSALSQLDLELMTDEEKQVYAAKQVASWALHKIRFAKLMAACEN